MTTTTIYAIIGAVIAAYEAYVYKSPLSAKWSFLANIVAILKFVKDGALLGVKSILGKPGVPAGSTEEQTPTDAPQDL